MFKQFSSRHLNTLAVDAPFKFRLDKETLNFTPISVLRQALSHFGHQSTTLGLVRSIVSGE
ncbi:MAG: hypothetical protein WC773_04725, partial [Patescibacteria group bacterium]